MRTVEYSILYNQGPLLTPYVEFGWEDWNGIEWMKIQESNRRKDLKKLSAKFYDKTWEEN